MHTKGKLTITSVEGGWDGIKCIDDNGQSTLICKMSTTNPDDIVRICHCVNSHDALLEACKAWIRHLELHESSEHPKSNMFCTSCPVYKEDFEKAIAQAEAVNT